MRITRIAIKSFLGIDHIDINIEKPVLLISGANASGKTSLAHGLRFVLADDLCRVTHKKDIKALVREGAKLGSVSVWLKGSDADFEYTRSATTGHFTSKHPLPIAHPALAYCLDPPAFVEMEANARLAFLYSLMGVNRSAASITKLLQERGHATAHIERIETHLSGGFAAAHTETMGLAREAKGRWREITGETYGEVKAEAWSSEAPSVNSDDITRLKSDIARHESEIGALQAQHGATLERKAERQRLVERMEHTAHIAGELQDRLGVEEQCRAILKNWTTEASAAKIALDDAEAGTTLQARVTQGLFFDCPQCHAHLVYSQGVCKVGEPNTVDAVTDSARAQEAASDARITFKEIEIRRQTAEQRLAETSKAVARAKAAKEALAELQAPEVAEEEGAEFEGTLASALKARGNARQALAALEAARKAHEEAKEKSARAKLLHEEIKALTALAADLAPDGLPGELLSRAMRPINERLRDSAVMAGWSSVSITTNGILIHSRPWALASGSERWRANAMIAEAIAHLSGVQCFVLDSLDILEPAQRAQALTWLTEVAPDHETVIVLCTLKAQPKELPAAIQAVWLG